MILYITHYYQYYVKYKISYNFITILCIKYNYVSYNIALCKTSKQNKHLIGKKLRKLSVLLGNFLVLKRCLKKKNRIVVIIIHILNYTLYLCDIYNHAAKI